MKFLAWLTLSAPLFCQSQVAHLSIPERSLMSAALANSFKPGLPVVEPRESLAMLSESVVLDLARFKLTSEAVRHEAWTELKVGATTKFHLPFKMDAAVGYFRGKFGHEFVVKISRRQ